MSVRSLSRKLIFLALIPFTIAIGYAQRTITTVVGTDFLFPGSTLPALSAPLGSVNGVAADLNGNIYAADSSNQMVVRVSPSGQLQIIAGNGLVGFTGDGSPATSRSLTYPFSLAIDQAGNVYFSEFARIRKVAPDGAIVTIAGGGNSTADNLPATSAFLSYPKGLTFDSAGSLYFADGQRVFKITRDGVLHVIAGNGKSGFSGDGGPALQASMSNPSGLAVDTAGNVYLSDYGDCRVRKINTAGIISTIAGTGVNGSSGDGGQAASAQINQPNDVAIDSAGNLYLLELHGLIRKVTTAGIISTILSTGLTFPQEFVIQPDGSFLIADTANFKLKKFSGGTLSTLAGNGGFRRSPDGTPALTAWLSLPRSIAFNSAGNLFLSDHYLEYGGIRQIAGGLLSTLPGTASLNGPRQISFDTKGNLYVAETYNGCQIHRITPAGQITPVTGICGFSGDGGPAASASLYIPEGVVAGPDNSIYISDTGNQRIRKIDPNGTIRTIAGNGAAGFGGDNGAATAAMLAHPSGLALDGAGNLYIADAENNRIRKVTPQGTISTVAGKGTFGFGGDGGPATAALLAYPLGVSVDAAGNLYIADTNNDRIRMVSTSGIISTVAGNGQRGFTGDGGFAINASLDGPSGVAIDSAGSLYIADTNNHRIRKVLSASPSFTATPATLTFTGTGGGSQSAAQTVSVGSSLPGLAFSAQTGATWLSITPESGSLPATLQVTADPSQLTAGSYHAAINVTVANAAVPTQTIAVTFNVAAGIQPGLSLSSIPLSFAFVLGAGGQESQQLRVVNQGGGSASFTATAATASGGSWLLVSPGSGTVTPASPAVLTITASPGQLPAGTYSGSVTVAGANAAGTFTIPVTMTINPSPQKLLLSQTGLTFTAVAQGGSVLPQSFGILNSGSGVLNWTAQATTLSGSGWLSLGSTSGTVNTPLLDVSFVDVIVNARTLPAGDYFGRIQVNVPGAANSPQTITVVLNILPAGANPGPEVRPTGLVFTGVAGGAGPGSQTVSVANVAGGRDLAYGSSPTYVNGANWLSYLPTNAPLDPAGPTRVVVQPDFTKLAPGIYRGAITFALSDGSIRNVAVLSVAASGSATGQGLVAHAACSPTQLQMLLSNPPQAFTANMGQPLSMEVRIVDDCGTPATPQRGSASVSASFGNGDPSVSMVHTQEGRWTATWQPRKGSPGTKVRVTVTALLALSSGKLLTYQMDLNAELAAGAPVPLPQSVADSASFLTTGSLAPGALISVFGTGMAATTTINSSVPLPSDLAGTEVTLGGQTLPLLYASNGQVNAQVPYDLTVNTQLQLQVKRNNTISVPQSLTVAPAQPAIFSADQSGSGQGVVVNAKNVLVDRNAPATAGDAIVIYCTGLGAVSPAVGAGLPAPSSPLSQTTSPATITIGGKTSNVFFAGLTPGFAGLYQVNVTVPSGVTPGDAVPVVIQIAGQTSPPVTIAVR